MLIHGLLRLLQQINNSILVVVVVISILILLLVLFSIYVMKSVSSSIRFVTDLSSQIAKGDLSVKVEKSRLTKDEIGILTSIIDQDVRQAFVSVEESRVVSEQRERLSRTKLIISQLNELNIKVNRLANCS